MWLHRRQAVPADTDRTDRLPYFRGCLAVRRFTAVFRTISGDLAQGAETDARLLVSARMSRQLPLRAGPRSSIDRLLLLRSYGVAEAIADSNQS